MIQQHSPRPPWRRLSGGACDIWLLQKNGLNLQARANDFPPFKSPALVAAWQTDQPMYSQYAKMEHLQTYFTQLARPYRAGNNGLYVVL